MFIKSSISMELILNLSDCQTEQVHRLRSLTYPPQPATSDEGDDCSLEINETTNLPDNASHWSAVENKFWALFIPLPELMMTLYLWAEFEANSSINAKKFKCLSKAALSAGVASLQYYTLKYQIKFVQHRTCFIDEKAMESTRSKLMESLTLPCK